MPLPVLLRNRNRQASNRLGASSKSSSSNNLPSQRPQATTNQQSDIKGRLGLELSVPGLKRRGEPDDPIIPPPKLLRLPSPLPLPSLRYCWDYYR
jgi:hypothetical protein